MDGVKGGVGGKGLLRNGFNEMEKWEKGKMGERVGWYMRMEEVGGLIGSGVEDGRVKKGYVFWWLWGVGMRDIVGVKWKNVFVDKGE